VDEAGRGPLAGPVVAGAVILNEARLPQDLLHGLNDSKKLSATKRADLFALLHTCGAALIGVGRAEVAEIDAINILNATYLAMQRAVAALPQTATIALIDGNRAPKLPCAVQTIVKGDAKSLSIAAASIIAKVTRDRVMHELAAAFPGYGWERNMGYGTAAHMNGIARLGITQHHRRTFAPIKEMVRG
jgi:ribonuclease HII